MVPFRRELNSRRMFLLARTRLNAHSFENTFRREVQAVDPDLSVRDIVTLDDLLALKRWDPRVFGSMFTIFAGIALMVATVGLYAVVAYGVSNAAGSPAGRISEVMVL